MPAAACPGTVQRYGYFPAFALSVAESPGVIIFVFVPAISKSWGSVPTFVTSKTTVPVGTVERESVNRNSDGFAAVTVTVVVARRYAVHRPARRLPPRG
jgi:hypothetical protein